MDTTETTIFTAIVITGVVIGTIFIYFTITIYRNHRKHFRLLSQNFVAEMELLEKERTRIATDLHDELGPILALTKIQLNSVDGLSSEQKIHLSKAENNIKLLTERFSGIAKNLTPKALVNKGLETALRDFLEQFENLTALKMELHYRIKSNLDILHSLHIYRMVQELIHNTIKHSGATNVQIELSERKNRIYILYKDNGIGFLKKKLNEKSNGLGLQSIRNRVEMLGGKMDNTATLKSGVEYFFEIPLQPIYGTKDNSISSR